MAAVGGLTEQELLDIDWESSFDSITSSPVKNNKAGKTESTILSPVNRNFCLANSPARKRAKSASVVSTPEKCLKEEKHEIPDSDLRSVYVLSQKRYYIESRVNSLADSYSVYEIRNENSNTKGQLELYDLWHQELVLEPGSLVNIVDAECENGIFKVRRNCGFVIVEPDILLSITSVMGQMWCERKAVLNEIFKQPVNSIDALRGTIAHDIIGRAMLNKITDRNGLQSLVKECLRSPAIKNTAYGCQLTHKDLEQLTEDLIVHIEGFMKNRFLGYARDQTIHFDEVLDIEDTYWSPTFGLKGKLDATVKITNKLNHTKIVPMEFKTGHVRNVGKHVSRSEHTGQVSLYTLLMRHRYGNVDSGLLLYIRENLQKEHNVPLMELQYLMCMRNKLALSSVSTKGHLKVPRPVNVEFEMKCERCELQSACGAFLRMNDHELQPRVMLTETKLQASSSFLQADDIEFFRKWMKVITLEIEDNEGAFVSTHIWKTISADREAKGTCISNLEFVQVSPVEMLDSNGNRCFLLTLTKSGWAETKLKTNLGEKDMIILSTQYEVCISYGIIETMSDSLITISVERKLHHANNQPHIRFTIDKIASNTVLQMQYTYISKILEPTPEAQRIRNYVIRKTPSKFAKVKLTDKSLENIRPIFKRFNPDQQRVMLKALQTDSFLFVKGMPGTGKTETIVGLVEVLVKQRFTVLLVAYTNNAVDNILLKYKNISEDFIRIGDGSRLGGLSLRSCSTSQLAQQSKTVDDLTDEYNQRPVVASTLMSLKHDIFRRRTFDYCLVDEASQALPTAVLGALVLAKKYILFGDPDQLPAVIKSARAREMNIEDNMFTLTAQPVNTVKLRIQYRMNSVIMELANNMVYKGQMTCGSEAQSERLLDVPAAILEDHIKSLSAKNQIWLRAALSNQSEMSVIFLETSSVAALEERIGETTRNTREADIVRFCVQSLVQCGLQGSDIGVIAPFRGQVAYIKQILYEKGDTYKCVEVNTVDQYQGRDKDVIICSFTKSKETRQDLPNSKPLNPEAEIRQSILEDIRRLNVAMTRAKKKLIMIGNQKTLQQFKPFQKLFQLLKPEQLVAVTSLDGVERKV